MWKFRFLYDTYIRIEKKNPTNYFLTSYTKYKLKTKTKNELKNLYVCITASNSICSSNPNPCLNGGLCRVNGTGYSCLCIPDFTGTHCEIGKTKTLSFKKKKTNKLFSHSLTLLTRKQNKQKSYFNLSLFFSLITLNSKYKEKKTCFKGKKLDPS